MAKILSKEDPILRQIAVEIPIADISTPKIQDLLKKMSSVLSKEEDGIALAAPQIGQSLRIFIVSGRLLWYLAHPDLPAQAGEEKKPKTYPPDLVFINPKIIKLSKEKKWIDEGCLSVRHMYGKMKRSTKTTIRAYNEKGKLFERGASGIMAQVFQHETDHLEGKLFIDKAKDLELLPPDNIHNE